MKLLKVIFIVLVLVTIGELGYYFYIKGNSREKSNTPTPNITISQAQSDTGPPSPSATRHPLEESFASSGIFEYINRKGQNDGQKLKIIFEQHGRVGEVALTQVGKSSPHFTIVDERGKKIATFVISDTLRLYSFEGEKKIPFTVTNLKSGDKIVFRIENDLVSSKELSEEFLIYPHENK